MRKTHIILLLILQSCLGLAQSYNGTYRIKYIQSSSSETTNNTQSEYQDYQENISIGNGIFEFKNQTVTIHNFRLDPIQTEINENQFLLNGIDFRIEMFSQDSVLLTPLKDEKFHLILKPFKTNDLQLNRADFLNSEWVIESQTSGLSSLKFHFTDSSGVIHNYQGKKAGYAHLGEWKILKSGKYYLLNIIDSHIMNEYNFYCYSKLQGTIIAEYSEIDHFENRLPITHEIQLVKQPLPSEEEILGIKRNLIGQWSFKNFENDLSYTFLDSLLNATYSLELDENNTYKLNYTFKAKIGDEDIDYENQESGNWEIASNGSYIIMRPRNSWEKYFTISSLDDKTLILDLDYYYEKRGTFGARIKLEKEN